MRGALLGRDNRDLQIGAPTKFVRRFVAGARALVGIGALSTVAFAAAFAHKPDTLTWTEPAGASGPQQADLLTTADYYGLRSFQMWEYGGKPCKLDLEQAAFVTGTVVRLDPLKVCEPDLGESWKAADIGAGHQITAIAACTGKDKADRAIHGLELFGATLEPDGKLEPKKGSVKLEFPGCKKWQPKRECPAGSVATGIRGFSDDAQRGFVGLALRCHALEPRGK